MNTLEITPQKQKQFDDRKQDHGDAAEQKGRRNDVDDLSENKYDRRAISKADKELYRVALQDMNYDQREAEADRILAENKEEEDEPESTEYQDFFPTEAELGLDSKHEIRHKLARVATGDPFKDDEVVDSTFGNAMRITNRP